jgi:hypothetical protein
MQREFYTALFLLLTAGPAAAGNRYVIVATADPAKGEIRGTVRLTYLNATSGALSHVPVQCDGEVSRITEPGGREFRFEPDGALKAYRIALARPLPRGARLELEIAFAGPYRFDSDAGYRLANGAWHPQALVFRDGRFGRHERQADSYEVTLTVPSAEVVAASGKLVEESALPDGTKRLRYRADNITNFGFASSPKLLHTVREAGGVEIRSYYFPQGVKWGTKLLEYAARIVPFYKETFGFYPQEALSILPGSKRSGGGYPAASSLIVVHDTLENRGEPFAEWITAHEIGHQYWGFDCVIDSGAYYHWPGLPLGIYTDRLYTAVHNPQGMGEYRRLVSTYLDGLPYGYDTTIRRTWAEINNLPFDFNNIVAHGKGFAVVQMLEDVVGKETFSKFIRTILERYRSGYLSFEDFRRMAEEVSGRRLDWFFQDWVDGNKVLRYAIEGVEESGAEARVKVRRIGTAAIPLEVEVLLADGTRLRKRIAREQKVQTITFPTKAKLAEVRLDPDGRTALYAPEAENVWGKKLQVMGVRLPEPPAWGSNFAVITVRNSDERPHEIEIDSRCSAFSVSRNFQRQTKQTLAAGAQAAIEHEFWVPAFPGKMANRLRLTDLDTRTRFFVHVYEAEFPLANSRANPFNAGNRIYPRLRMVERGHFVFYYIDGDSCVESRLEDIGARRERAYKELAAKINPAFKDKVAVYLLPDADTKTAYTVHWGMGWAVGNMLFEIYNEKERLDPNHELVHIIGHSVGNPPALFDEGLAAYMQEGERWDDYHIDSWCKAFAGADLLIPVSQLFTFTEIGSDKSKPGIAYPEAASLVKYLVETYGLDKFMIAFRELKSGDADRGRFAKIFGASLEEVEKAWLARLGTSAVEPVPESKVSAVRAKYVPAP